MQAEVISKFYKALFLDVGLCSSALKLSFFEIDRIAEIELINNGGIAEQVVGQLLRTIFPLYQDPELYYWLSFKKGTNAEIDYTVQHGRTVVSIEVKAGDAGTLKSLHRFM